MINDLSKIRTIRLTINPRIAQQTVVPTYSKEEIKTGIGTGCGAIGTTLRPNRTCPWHTRTRSTTSRMYIPHRSRCRRGIIAGYFLVTAEPDEPSVNHCAYTRSSDCEIRVARGYRRDNVREHLYTGLFARDIA